jgi:hypothetical protein
MSTGSHRGPLPLLNVSGEDVWQWRQHRLATSKAYEILLGYPAPRAAHRTGLLHLIDTSRTGDGANSRPLSSLRVLRTWRSTSRRSSL